MDDDAGGLDGNRFACAGKLMGGHAIDLFRREDGGICSMGR